MVIGQDVHSLPGYMIVLQQGIRLGNANGSGYASQGVTFSSVHSTPSSTGDESIIMNDHVLAFVFGFGRGAQWHHWNWLKFFHILDRPLAVLSLFDPSWIGGVRLPFTVLQWLLMWSLVVAFAPDTRLSAQYFTSLLREIEGGANGLPSSNFGWYRL